MSWFNLPRRASVAVWNFICAIVLSMCSKMRKSKVENAPSSLNFDKVPSMSDFEVQTFTDSRGFNLLMLASEAGHIEAVQNLINRGEDVNREVNGETAASLAYDRGHHQVLLALLHANSKIPGNYVRRPLNRLSFILKFFISSILWQTELEKFIKFSCDLHHMIRTHNLRDEQILIENLQRFKTLKYFYDTKNNSLLKRATLCRKFKIYEILLQLGLSYAPHESMSDINSYLYKLNLCLVRNQFELDEEELKEKASENYFNDLSQRTQINEKISSDLMNEDLMILMRNCKLSPDNTKQGEYLDIIRQAFDDLFEIPQIAIILKVVAATRDFKIILDFDREWLDFLDPLNGGDSTNGLCYFNGMIKLAVKGIFDENKYREVYGVIAHELCHYAMAVVFENLAKPYKSDDEVTKNRFKLIIDECRGIFQRNRNIEKIIAWVFTSYKDEEQIAELIVRPPHIMAVYSNTENVRNEFKSVFDFYDEIRSKMEQELPKIKSKFDPFRKQKEAQNKSWRTFVGILFFGAILIVIEFCDQLQQAKISWSDLELNEKFFVKSVFIGFHGVDVRLGELFAGDSHVYRDLNSKFINQALNDGRIEMSKSLEAYYENHVYLTWSNMTRNLREHFFTLDVNFQGQNVSVIDIFDHETLETLNAIEIRKILNKFEFKIGKQIIREKFIIERFFIDESYGVLNSLKRNLSDGLYENFRIKATHPNVKNFNNIVEELENNRIFILSNFAGEGKSTTFKNFEYELKRLFPWKWIQFIDLKRHFDTFKKVNFMEENFEKVIIKSLLKLSKLESKIFLNQFQAGDVIFIFDGVDEIFPKFEETFMSLLEILMNKTKNIQMISTRPQYSAKLKERLNVKAFNLIPFGEFERLQFILNLVTSRNVNLTDKLFSDVDYQLSVYRVFKESTEILSTFVPEMLELMNALSLSVDEYTLVLNNLEIHAKIEIRNKRKLVSSPILIKIISELYFDEVYANRSFTNFELYRTLIAQKFQIILDKGRIVTDDFYKMIEDEEIWQAHHAYTLNYFFAEELSKNFPNSNIFGYKVAHSRVKIWKVFNKISHDQISRLGIIQFDSKSDFTFIHYTFAEFFIAQFMIQNMNDLDATTDDGRLKILIFEDILNSSGASGILEFIEYEKVNEICEKMSFYTEILSEC